MVIAPPTSKCGFLLKLRIPKTPAESSMFTTNNSHGPGCPLEEFSKQWIFLALDGGSKHTQDPKVGMKVLIVMISYCMIPSGKLTVCDIENGPVEIVSFPALRMVMFHSYVSLPEGK